jgi:hypothetical protein
VNPHVIGLTTSSSRQLDWEDTSLAEYLRAAVLRADALVADDERP